MVSYDFQVTGLQETVDRLRGLNSKAITLTFDELERDGVEIVKANLRAQPFKSYPQELEDSGICERLSPFSLRLSADAGFALFVEFGTGMVGRDNSVTTGRRAWESSHRDRWGNRGSFLYDRHRHEWLSPGKGWVYYKNGKFHFTQGQPGKPFMYHTAIELNHSLPEALHKHIRALAFGGGGGSK